LCAQDDLEPVLRTFAEQQGTGDLKFSTEAVAFEQEGDGVTVALEDHGGGEKETVCATYVIAADGAQSRIRRKLGTRNGAPSRRPLLYRNECRLLTAKRKTSARVELYRFF
jgi:2-polyprenyl-6-methoxyphenol hydroxylase-like FAD-dependent oxidoreductase